MSASAQHQIRDNAAELQSYLSELGQWTQDVKRKDAALKGSVAAPSAVPVRGEPSVAPAPRAPAAAVAVAAAAGGIAASSEPADDSADGWRERGNAAFKAGEFGQAEAHYGASLRLTPTAAAFANRALARLKLARPAEAEADCSAALALEPGYVKALQRRAAAHAACGHLLQAAADLDAAARLEPANKTLRAERAAAVAAYEASAPAPSPLPLDVPLQPLPPQEQAHTPPPPPPTPVAVPPPPPAPVAAPSPAKRGKGSIVEVSSRTPQPATREAPAPAPRSAPAPASPGVEALAAEAAAKAAERPLEAAPRSGLEYEQAWAQAAERPEQQLRLLQLVPPASLPALLKNALSAPVLCAVQRAALRLLLPAAPDDALAVLRALSAVPRFQMVTMLVPARDKAALQADWEAAVAAAPPAVAEPLRSLRTLFRC